MFAYCLYCQTQKCKKISAWLEQKPEVNTAFSPRILKRQRKLGRNIDIEFDLLPGYVFVYTDHPLSNITVLRNNSGVIRVLGNSENLWMLTNGDFEFAMNLYKKDGKIPQLSIIKTGETVILKDPIFNSTKGQVTKIDFKQQRARIDYEFAGAHCFTWVAMELLEIDKNENIETDKK